MNPQVSIHELYPILKDYKIIEEFILKFPKVTLAEFDHYTVSDMSLFMVKEDINFDLINQTIDKINSALPAMNRIFIKPIIQLNENDEVVPIETVRTINHKTMQHIALHSELWDNVTDDGIKPQKLLSRTYQDNYSIYENIVFARTINECISYLKKQRKEFQNIFYASKILEYNLLERVNHLDYFLAIGKLHTGYIRGFEQYLEVIKPINEKINLILDKLTSKLKYNVYRKNRSYKGKLVLRQTNILHMQKDYHQVYLLLKYFEKNHMIKLDIDLEDENTQKELHDFYKNYIDFCNLLLIFSLIHFGFTCDKETIIDLNETKVTFNNKKWSVTLEKINNEENSTYYLLLSVTKDKTYKILFSPLSIKNERIENYILDYDELITLSPIDEIKNTVYLSIYDIDSFRKFQQIILRAMVKSDKMKDDCPFCHGKLKKLEHPEMNDNESYLCKSCHTYIGIRNCDIYQQSFPYTTIYKYNINKNSNTKDDLSIDAKYHYRNITLMTKDGDVICPICNKVHKKV